jgi:hypothetical protein
VEDENLPITGFGDKKGSQFGLRELPVIEERTQEMTPKERANKILGVDDWLGSDSGKVALLSRIEQAITAAVEEEREAMIALIDRQKKEYEELGRRWAEESRNTNANPVARSYAVSVGVCEDLIRKIRARGNKD